MTHILPRLEYHELLGLKPADSEAQLLAVLGEVFDPTPESQTLPVEEMLARNTVESGRPWLATERALLQRQFEEMRKATQSAFAAEIDQLEQLFAENRILPFQSRLLYQRSGQVRFKPLHWCFKREILLLDRIDQYFFAEAAPPTLLKGALFSLAGVANKPSPAGTMHLMNMAAVEDAMQHTARLVAEFMPLWAAHLAKLGASEQLQHSGTAGM